MCVVWCVCVCVCVFVWVLCACVFPSSPSTLEPQCHQSRFESIQTERHELLGGREGREVQVSPRVLGHGTGTDVFLKKRRSTHTSQLVNQRTCFFLTVFPSLPPLPRSLPHSLSSSFPTSLPTYLPSSLPPSSPTTAYMWQTANYRILPSILETVPLPNGLQTLP